MVELFWKFCHLDTDLMFFKNFSKNSTTLSKLAQLVSKKSGRLI